MRRSMLDVILLLLLLLVPGSARAWQSTVQHQHQPAAKAQPADDMMAKCQPLMAQQDRIMSDMKAADLRLDDLVARMNSASGEAKVDATATALTELVAQRKAMRDGMKTMHDGMMGHIMEHMQAGPQAMAACPMMKGMGK